MRDDDTPGVLVLQVQPGTSTEDNRTVVIEGNATTGAHRRAARPARREAGVRATVVVHLKLDEDSEERISISRGDALDTRYDPAARTITFTSARAATGTARSGSASRRATTTGARIRGRP